MTSRGHSASMYERFLFQKTNKAYDILNNIKNLTLNSNKFTKYIDYYNLNTQSSSFKEPDNDIYPILRNNDFIPIQKQNNISKNEKKKYKKNKKASLKNLLLSNSNSKGESINEFVYISHKKNLTTLSSTLEQNTLEQNKTYSTNFFKNITLKKKVNKKNEFILCDLLFNEECYQNLDFQEELIFHRKSYYIELMKEKIVQLKVNKENRLNNSSELKHDFYNEKLGKIELILSSIKIELKNLSSPKSRSYSFEIPFDYVPLFFIGNFHDMKQLLLEFFSFNKNYQEDIKIKNIKFNDDYLNEYIFYQFDENGSIVSYLKNLNLDKNTIALKDVPKLFISTADDHYSKYLKDEEKEDTILRDLNFIEDDISKYNEKCNCKIFRRSNNKYEFDWINPEGHYSIKVSMPNISLRFHNIKKFINHFIDKELFMYLLEKKFIYWDYYVVHYLFSIKYFRIFIQRLLSKNIGYISTNILKNDERQYLNFDIQKIGDNEFYSITNRYNNTINNSLNDYDYSFILTDPNTLKNYLIKIISYTIYISYPYFGDEVHKFSMNFHQMKILYLRSKIENLKSFILKLLYIDKKAKKMHIDYSYFAIFNNYTIEQIEEYFNKFDLDYQNDFFNKNESSDKLQIYIVNPQFEIVQMKEVENFDEKIWMYCRKEISDKILLELINSDINNWGTIINNNQINFHDIVIEYNHLHEFKTFKTYSSVKKSTTRAKKSVLYDKIGNLNFASITKKKTHNS